jgi:hypothetical protein
MTSDWVDNVVRPNEKGGVTTASANSPCPYCEPTCPWCGRRIHPEHFAPWAPRPWYEPYRGDPYPGEPFRPTITWCSDTVERCR